ncbi:MAG: helix-turn-helix domain-containing protein [Parasphingopyxis sp.]|uniref:helix-turn-helix domain-containing protein n=1 Tax=Parasphingopyxis sp. TaxID=1920299 RepID=UPI003F9FD6C9
MEPEFAGNVIPLHREPTCRRTLAVHVSPGQALFWEGDEARQLFRIEAGVVRSVNFSSEGERQVTGFFFPGDVIGVPLGGRCRYTAEAVTEVRYSTQGVECWTEELRCTQNLDDTLFGTVRSELEASYTRSLLLGRQGALARMCSFLADVCARLGHGDETVLPMPQTDIAAYLALTPETVCRSFRKLKDIGAVRIEKHDCIRVVDPGRIMGLASH